MTQNDAWIYKLFGMLFPLLIVTPSFAAGVYLCPTKEGLLYQELPCSDPSQQKIIKIDPYPATTNKTVDESTSNKTPIKPAFTKETEIVLTKDPNSQFRVDGTINGVEVKFLIDTGANIIAIPEDIAKFARLPIESTIMANTASGSVTDFKTTIRKLKIGNILELQDIPATIIKGNQALLGMNVLEKFEMIQKDNTLTLKLK